MTNSILKRMEALMLIKDLRKYQDLNLQENEPNA